MGAEQGTLVDRSSPPLTLDARTLPAVAEYIKSRKATQIVVMTGAGISTAAGIPDFRSPKTGLYNNLARLNLPHPKDVFDISYFREHPEPFYILAQELYPGKFHPTISHAMIALLAQKGLLRGLFTQNIDCLDRAAGVPADKIVEAHGSFATQRCIECKLEYPDDDMKEHVLNGRVPHCKDCNGLVKPDITFFGEALPRAFSEKSHRAIMADLVLIMGTSLSVYPFASLPEMVRQSTPRVLFNTEKVGMLGSRQDDVLELGPCDQGIRKLADKLGWGDELEELWRSIVGDEEAERQLQCQEKPEEDTEDEVQKLTEGIESALRLQGDDEQSSSEGEDNEAKTLRVASEILASNIESVESRSVKQTATAPEQPLQPNAEESPLKTTASAKSAAEPAQGKPDKEDYTALAKDARNSKIGEMKEGDVLNNACSPKPLL